MKHTHTHWHTYPHTPAHPPWHPHTHAKPSRARKNPGVRGEKMNADALQVWPERPPRCCLPFVDPRSTNLSHGLLQCLTMVRSNVACRRPARPGGCAQELPADAPNQFSKKRRYKPTTTASVAQAPPPPPPLRARVPNHNACLCSSATVELHREAGYQQRAVYKCTCSGKVYTSQNLVRSETRGCARHTPIADASRTFPHLPTPSHPSIMSLKS